MISSFQTLATSICLCFLDDKYLPEIKMLDRSQTATLRVLIGPDYQILEDSAHASFQENAKRWTDLGHKIPAAIVLPRTEVDIQKTVQWAVKYSTPFVTKSGGCSEWSTIGDAGVAIDLTHYSEIEIDAKAQTGTIRGGAL